MSVESLEARTVFSAGDLDPTFAQASVVTLDGYNWVDQAFQADGKIVAVGSTAGAENPDFVVARFNSDGSLDAAFGTSGVRLIDVGGGADVATSVAIDEAGKIVVAGNSSLDQTFNYDFAVARLNSDGSLDTTFAGDGTLTVDFQSGRDEAYSVVFDDDGKILVVGSAGNPETQLAAFAAVRIDSDGSLDASFDADGKVTVKIVETAYSEIVYSAAVDANGRIVLGGTSNFADALVRLNADGSSDATFDGDGKLTLADRTQVRALTINANGKIVFGGLDNNAEIGRLNADGSNDETFGTAGRVNLGYEGDEFQVGQILINSVGQLIIAGTLGVGGRDADLAAVRLSAMGEVDLSFGIAGYSRVDVAGLPDRLQGATIDSEGRIVLTGGIYAPVYNRHRYTADVTTRISFARLGSNGALDSTFSGNGKTSITVGGEAVYVAALAVQSDHKVVVVGTYEDDFFVRRYLADGSIDVSFGEAGTVRLDLNAGSRDQVGGLALTTDGKIVVVGTAESSVAVALLHGDGTLDESFSGDGKATYFVSGQTTSTAGVAIDGDGRFVVAGSSSPSTHVDFFVLRVNADGSLDASFDGDGKAFINSQDARYDFAHSLVLTPEGKIVVAGESTAYNSIDSNVFVARLNGDGSLDTSFNSDGRLVLDVGAGESDRVFSAALDAEGRLVLAGEVYAEDGGKRQYAALAMRLDVEGALDESFGVGGTAVLNLGWDWDGFSSVAVDDAGRLVLGGQISGDFGVVRLNAEGALDSTFNGNGVVQLETVGLNEFGYSLALDGPDRFVLGGFARYGGQVVRFNLLPTAPTDSDAAPNVVAHGAAGGTLVGVTAGATDPGGATITYSLLDDAGGRFVIDATTGVVSVNAAGPGISHASSGGAYTIVASASDGIGATSSEFIINVTAPTSAVFLTEDPLHSGVPSLFIYGASGNDVIDVDPGKKGTTPGTVVVTLNKVKTTLVLPVGGWINVFAGDGNDKVDVNSKLTNNAYLEGGDGNDKLNGGRGDDVIVGGAGNDALNGRGGRDLVIGGVGKDKVYGAGTGSSSAREGNLLIGDATDFENDREALAALAAAWSANSPTTIDDTVRSYLNDDSVLEDGQADALKGTSKGTDWFWSFELTSKGKRLDKLSSYSTKSDGLN